NHRQRCRSAVPSRRLQPASLGPVLNPRLSSCDERAGPAERPLPFELMETGWRSVAELFWRPLRTSVLIRQVWKNHFSAIADPSDRHEEGEQRWHYGSRGCEGRFRWDERLDSLSLCPNVQSILERVTDFCAGHPANDDCTVVRVTFTGLA